MAGALATGAAAAPASDRAATRIAARGLARLEAGLDGVSVMLLAALLAVVIAGVVARYVFGAALLGSDELAIWLNVGLVFVGFPMVAGSALAMRIDVATRRLGTAGQAVAAVVADGIVVQASLVFLSGGLLVLDRVGGTSTALGLPAWLRFAPLPAAGAIGIAAVLLRTLAAGRGLPSAVGSLAVGGGLYAATRLLEPHLPGLPSAVAGLAAGAGLLLGAPLPHALIAGLSAAIPFDSLLPEAGVAQNTVTGVSKFLLLAIPFFILAGVLMHQGGLGDRLVRFASAMVGHRRGGLAQTTLLTNLLFAGVSGSSIADAAFGAKVLAPGLVARGYPPERAGAIVAATSILPNIEPLSIAFLILSVATNLSVGSLFMGGLVGGLTLALVLAVTLHVTSLEPASTVRASRAERLQALVAALPVMGLGVVILLGIRFGVVTPTEAGAIAAAYSLVAGLVLRPELRTGGLYQCFSQAGRAAAAVGLLIGSSAPFTFLLAVDQLPQAITDLFVAHGWGPFGVMAAANGMLLVAGCLLDIGAAILLLAPLLLPVATAVGLDPNLFGVVLVINLVIHGLTPPIGVLVLVTSGLMGVPAGRMFRSALPFIGVLLSTLAVMAVLVAVQAVL